MNIATVGYEKVKVPVLLRHLLSHNVTCIVDVRENPWSNRPDCRRQSLELAAHGIGLRYLHVKYAGNPKSIRVDSADPADALRRYGHYLANNPEIPIQLYYVAELEAERGGKICLLCYENQHTECHRSVLTKSIELLDPSVCVTHVDGITGLLQPQTRLSIDRPAPEATYNKRSRVVLYVA